MANRQRIFGSYEPTRGRDENADRRINVKAEFFGKTFNASNIQLLYRAPDWVKIIRASLVVSTAVPSANESFWGFQLRNESHPNTTTDLISAPVTTTTNPLVADTPMDITANQNNILGPGDVLSLQMVKTGGPVSLQNLIVYLELELSDVTTTTSSSTTSSTTTTTTTSTTTSTSSSTSSSTTTSTSSTTVTTTSTTITTSSTTTVSTSSSTSTTTTSSSTSTSSTTTTTLSTSTTTT